MTDEHSRARREFVLKALAVLPAAKLMGGCAMDGEQAEAELQALQREPHRHPSHAHDKRLRWRQLLDVHMGWENKHDLDGVLSTFSGHGEMIFNRTPFTTPEQIAQGHVLFGFSNQPGSLANTQVVPEREYYTDDSILVEGVVIGDHVGPIGAFPATQRRVRLYYSAFYRFDDQGELESERIVMNWAVLAAAPPM